MCDMYPMQSLTKCVLNCHLSFTNIRNIKFKCWSHGQILTSFLGQYLNYTFYLHYHNTIVLFLLYSGSLTDITYITYSLAVTPIFCFLLLILLLATYPTCRHIIWILLSLSLKNLLLYDPFFYTCDIFSWLLSFYGTLPLAYLYSNNGSVTLVPCHHLQILSLNSNQPILFVLLTLCHYNAMISPS